MAAIGQTLLAGAVVFTPWMMRGGDNGLFLVELIDVGGGGTLTVDLFHKNSEDQGDGTDYGTSIVSATSTTGRHAKELTGLKELVRFKITVGGSGSNWVHYRILNTVWFNRGN